MFLLCSVSYHRTPKSSMKFTLYSLQYVGSGSNGQQSDNIVVDFLDEIRIPKSNVFLFLITLTKFNFLI